MVEIQSHGMDPSRYPIDPNGGAVGDVRVRYRDERTTDSIFGHIDRGLLSTPAGQVGRRHMVADPSEIRWIACREGARIYTFSSLRPEEIRREVLEAYGVRTQTPAEVAAELGIKDAAALEALELDMLEELARASGVVLVGPNQDAAAARAELAKAFGFKVKAKR